ncbi:hypothetical protein OHB24_21345 [Kribbella sp. NBC_00482]|uniref:hypothetical protein n=1 Tax=Kribbella sp. NBC_00482 TaxID=2975968 RepID=UPI002E1878BC
MKDWSCNVEFALSGDNLAREAACHLTRAGVRAIPQKPGHYAFNSADSHEDYLQALMGTVGKLDAILLPYGVTREIRAFQVVELP